MDSRLFLDSPLDERNDNTTAALVKDFAQDLHFSSVEESWEGSQIIGWWASSFWIEGMTLRPVAAVDPTVDGPGPS